MAENAENQDSTTVLQGFRRLSEVARANPHLFPNIRSLQDFTQRHREELIEREAIARLGIGKNSKVLVHPERLAQFLRDAVERGDAA